MFNRASGVILPLLVGGDDDKLFRRLPFRLSPKVCAAMRSAGKIMLKRGTTAVLCTLLDGVSKSNFLRSAIS